MTEISSRFLSLLRHMIFTFLKEIGNKIVGVSSIPKIYSKVRGYTKLVYGHMPNCCLITILSLDNLTLRNNNKISKSLITKSDSGSLLACLTMYSFTSASGIIKSNNLQPMSISLSIENQMNCSFYTRES